MKTIPQPITNTRKLRLFNIIAFKTPANLYSTGTDEAGQDSVWSWLPFGRKIASNVTRKTQNAPPDLPMEKVLRPVASFSRPKYKHNHQRSKASLGRHAICALVKPVDFAVELPTWPSGDPPTPQTCAQSFL